MALSYPQYQPQTRHTLRHELPALDQTRSAVFIPRRPMSESPHLHPPPALSSAITGGKDNEGYLPLLVSILLFKVQSSVLRRGMYYTGCLRFFITTELWAVVA